MILEDFSLIKRAVDRVFIHCTASSNGGYGVEEIRRDHRALGWDDIGYHFLINFNGVLQRGRPLKQDPAAQRGHNTGTIAICLQGLEVEDFTQFQFETLRELCEKIDQDISPHRKDRVTFHGHCEVANKLCPVFDYKSVLNLTEEGFLPNRSDPISNDPFSKLNSLVTDLQREIEILRRRGDG